MADAGSIYAAMGANIADSITTAADKYHREHLAYDQQLGAVQALSQMGYDKQGNIVSLMGPDGKKLPDVKPAIDPKLIEMVTSNTKLSRAEMTGRLKQLNDIGEVAARTRIHMQAQEEGLAGQRTRQIMQQEEEMQPLKKAQMEASTKHIQKITDEEGKINVPGFGMMTPSQYSTHVARQERMDVLKKKSEPILGFENALQNKYGLGIQDIVDASKPQEFQDPRGNKYKGTPFYNATGALVSSDAAAKNPESTFVLAGANKIPIPLLDKQGGLGWQQITGKAKNFSDKLSGLQQDQADIQKQNQQAQAQQIIAVNKGRDPATLSPQDKQALDWANQIIGQ